MCDEPRVGHKEARVGWLRPLEFRKEFPQGLPRLNVLALSTHHLQNLHPGGLNILRVQRKYLKMKQDSMRLKNIDRKKKEIDRYRGRDSNPGTLEQNTTQVL